MVAENLSQIRQGIADLLVDVGGFASALPRPSENVGSLPHVQVGFLDLDLSLSMGTETGLYRFPLVCFVARKGRIDDEVATVEQMLPGVIQALGADALIELPYISRCVATRIREGIFGHAGSDYIGFEATVEVKERT